MFAAAKRGKQTRQLPVNCMAPKFRIHPLLAFIYALLRYISLAGLYVFYRRRWVWGLSRAQFDGPVILISNHPSTLMDVLNIGIHVPRIIFFLANYSLFKHPVSNWLLSRLYCIPIKRKEDVPEGELRNNDVYFEQSYRHLEAGGLLYIAPEGVSWMERWVRPFKTGTARIAFGTESRNGFDLGLKIIPVGLSYEAPNLFRSEMMVQFGAPVSVKTYARQWQEDPEKAVDTLTADLEASVRALSVDGRSEPGGRMLTQMERIAQAENPLEGQPAFERGQRLAAQLLDRPVLHRRIDAYFSHLTEAELTDSGLKDWMRPGANKRFVLEGLLLFITAPLFMLGLGFWILPCFIPWAVARQMNLYIGYDSNVKMIVGLFTFPLAFWAAGCWIPPLLPFACPVWALFIVLILLGYFVEWYWRVALRVLWRWRAASVSKYHKGMYEELISQRAAIVQELAPYL